MGLAYSALAKFTDARTPHVRSDPGRAGHQGQGGNHGAGEPGREAVRNGHRARQGTRIRPSHQVGEPGVSAARKLPISPATFLATSTFWQDPDSQPSGAGFTSYDRVLHGAQEYVFFGGPPRAGTTLTVQSKPGLVYEKTGRRGGVMTFHELVTEYRARRANSWPSRGAR